jgi:hypothetical protein
MTRSQRSVHRVLWVVLALAMGIGFAVALLLRAPAHAGTPAATMTSEAYT